MRRLVLYFLSWTWLSERVEGHRPGVGFESRADVPAKTRPVPVWRNPGTFFSRLLHCFLSVIQLPFYTASLALLLRFEAIQELRSGCGRNTRVATPIRLSLQSLRQLRDAVVKKLEEDEAAREGWSSEAKRETRVTLNDLFAACIVGGHYRYSQLPRTISSPSADQLVNPPSHDHDLLLPLQQNESLNFVIPVNVRTNIEQAKQLNNQFASLIIALPVNPRGNPLKRYEKKSAKTLPCLLVQKETATESCMRASYCHYMLPEGYKPFTPL